MIRLSAGGCLSALTIALGLSAALAAPKGQVDLCHRTGQGYNPLSVNANALPAHLGHGDALRPNGVVPGSPGFVFDNACRPVSWGYAVNVAPDPAAIDPASPGNLFAGGGIPAHNFAVARNEAAGIELGFMILYRQGPSVTSTDDYADGALSYQVAAGPQSTDNGSFGNNLARAAWNYTFSIATGLNGATTNISDYAFRLLVDVDPGPGVSYRTFNLEPDTTPLPGQSGFQWRDQDSGIVVMSDDEGNVQVTQNSQNYAFYSALTGSYVPPVFPGPAVFDIVLQALSGPQIVVSNHIVINVQ